MNPWSVKMIHQLSESEMLHYAGHLQEHMLVEREEDIDRAVEHIMEQMRSGPAPLALSPYGRPYCLNLPTSKAAAAYVGQTPMTPVVSSFDTVTVKVYPWMDEKMARYVVREQIIEQTQPDVG